MAIYQPLGHEKTKPIQNQIAKHYDGAYFVGKKTPWRFKSWGMRDGPGRSELEIGRRKLKMGDTGFEPVTSRV